MDYKVGLFGKNKSYTLKESMEACIELKNQLKSIFGPGSHDQYVIEENGQITLSNDGYTVLSKLCIENPMAQLLRDTSQGIDKIVGDGTTSVVILTGCLLEEAKQLMEDYQIHPMTIIREFNYIFDTYILKELESIKSGINDNFSQEQRVRSLIHTVLQSKLERDISIQHTIYDAMKKTQWRYDHQTTCKIKFIECTNLSKTTLLSNDDIVLPLYQPAVLPSSFRAVFISLPKDLFASSKKSSRRNREEQLVQNYLFKKNGGIHQEKRLETWLKHLLRFLITKRIQVVFIDHISYSHIQSTLNEIRPNVVFVQIHTTNKNYLKNHFSIDFFTENPLVHSMTHVEIQDCPSGSFLFSRMAHPEVPFATLLVGGQNELATSEVVRALHDVLCVLHRSLHVSKELIYGGGHAELHMVHFLKNVVIPIYVSKGQFNTVTCIRGLVKAFLGLPQALVPQEAILFKALKMVKDNKKVGLSLHNPSTPQCIDFLKDPHLSIFELYINKLDQWKAAMISTSQLLKIHVVISLDA